MLLSTHLALPSMCGVSRGFSHADARPALDSTPGNVILSVVSPKYFVIFLMPLAHVRILENRKPSLISQHPAVSKMFAASSSSVFYSRRFIKRFSEIAETLPRLQRKGESFVWHQEQSTALDHLKRSLTSAPVLAHFSDRAPTATHTDASGHNIGAKAKNML